MSRDPAAAIGSSYLSLAVWRLLRTLTYVAVGFFRPSWRRAIPLLRARDAYADRATLAVQVYSDPRFARNMEAIEDELRAVRSGAASRRFQLPEDFPPGARDLVGKLLTQ